MQQLDKEYCKKQLRYWSRMLNKKITASEWVKEAKKKLTELHYDKEMEHTYDSLLTLFLKLYAPNIIKNESYWLDNFLYFSDYHLIRMFHHVRETEDDEFQGDRAVVERFNSIDKVFELTTIFDEIHQKIFNIKTKIEDRKKEQRIVR